MRAWDAAAQAANVAEKLSRYGCASLSRLSFLASEAVTELWRALNAYLLYGAARTRTGKKKRAKSHYASFRLISGLGAFGLLWPLLSQPEVRAHSTRPKYLASLCAVLFSARGPAATSGD